MEAKHYDEDYISFHTKILELDKKVAIIENTIGWSDRMENLFKELQGEALKLQGGEYERRLTELNHAHEKAVIERNLTLPREAFNVFAREYDKWKAEIAVQATGIFTKEMFEAWKKEHELWKKTVAPIADMRIISDSISELKAVLNKFYGFLWFLGVAGISGVIALVMQILKMVR